MSKALIVGRNLSKSFDLGGNQIRGLSGVHIEFLAGGMSALVGPSGSGKSTLLNLFGALDLPTEGELIIDGQNLIDLSADQRAEFRNRNVGFIFQNFNLIPVLTALENVLLPSQLGSKLRKLDMTPRAITLLEKVGLHDQINQAANRLSGGQMQRVAIARALINSPKLILADEPTANLDHSTAKVVLELLGNLCRDEGVTVIVATHDPEVLPYCQRVVRMRDGMIAVDS
jgi:putative ABC transport system ATP-binding protein